MCQPNNYRACYKTRNNGTRNYTEHGTTTEHWNTDRTPKQWQNNRTLTEQSKYHGIAEQEINETTPRNATSTDQQYTGTADNITKIKTTKSF